MRLSIRQPVCRCTFLGHCGIGVDQAVFTRQIVRAKVNESHGTFSTYFGFLPKTRKCEAICSQRGSKDSLTMSSRQSRSSQSCRRNKRITDATTCIDIDLDIPIICSQCCEKKQRILNSRVMKKSLDDSLSWNQCRQPWVLRGESPNDYRIYNKAWSVLVDDLGYPPPQLH